MEAKLPLLYGGLEGHLTNELSHKVETKSSEISSENQLVMKWGCMATYISKFFSKTYPNCKVCETGVHIVSDDKGIPW